MGLSPTLIFKQSRGAKGGTFPLVSLVVIGAGLGWGGVKVMDAGAAALVVVARCSWAEPVAWCCPVAMAVRAVW